jgi:hypothetical protein
MAGQNAPPASTSTFLPDRIRPAPEKTAAGFTPDRISTTAEIKEVARAGVQGRGGKLPHLARIQPALEKHDLGGVRAFTDSHAAAACRALGAIPACTPRPTKLHIRSSRDPESAPPAESVARAIDSRRRRTRRQPRSAGAPAPGTPLPAEGTPPSPRRRLPNTWGSRRFSCRPKSRARRPR